MLREITYYSQFHSKTKHCLATVTKQILSLLGIVSKHHVKSWGYYTRGEFNQVKSIGKITCLHEVMEEKK